MGQTPALAISADEPLRGHLRKKMSSGCFYTHKHIMFYVPKCDIVSKTLCLSKFANCFCQYKMTTLRDNIISRFGQTIFFVRVTLNM